MTSPLLSATLWSQLSMVSVGLLIGLLVVREALRVYDSRLLEARGRWLNVAIVPLLLVAAVTLAARIGELLF
ncbi:MAG: hypothetical protein HPY64_17250 [Anaerolineae bacterium]|nr:hypothetical protein [Anaerolineae bacterium]